MLRFRMQGTPNPKARKYILNEEVKALGKVTYKDQAECAHVPLAYYLLGVNGIKQVHLFENIITITQDGSCEWSELDQLVQASLIKQIDNHDIFFKESLMKVEEKKNLLTGDLLVIDQILDKTIRPSLQMDGGDVVLLSLDDNILTIQYQGACSDCPSSLSMTLAGIESVIHEGFRPDIRIVVKDQ